MKTSTRSRTRSASTRFALAWKSQSGRSSSTSPSSSTPSSTTGRAPTMSQSRRADGDSPPQTAALGFDVVGRRAPTRATSASARTLNRLDLPLPVAPANATTVRPWAIEVRTDVLAMATCALSTPSAGRHPSPDSRADLSAAARAWTDSAETSATAPIAVSVVEAARNSMPSRLIASLADSSRSLDSDRGSLDPASLPCTDLDGRNGCVQACLLSGIQLLRPGHQLEPSLCGKAPNCLVTENGLKDALGQDCRTARDADLAARKPGGLTQHQEHEDDANTVDTKREHPRRGTPVVGRCADHVENLSLPVSNQPLDVARALWGRVCQLGVSRHQRRSPRQLTPPPESGPRSPAGLRSQELGNSRSQRLAKL